MPRQMTRNAAKASGHPSQAHLSARIAQRDDAVGDAGGAENAQPRELELPPRAPARCPGQSVEGERDERQQRVEDEFAAERPGRPDALTGGAAAVSLAERVVRPPVAGADVAQAGPRAQERERHPVRGHDSQDAATGVAPWRPSPDPDRSGRPASGDRAETRRSRRTPRRRRSTGRDTATAHPARSPRSYRAKRGTRALTPPQARAAHRTGESAQRDPSSYGVAQDLIDRGLRHR